jgi:hypothetical protein
VRGVEVEVDWVLQQLHPYPLQVVFIAIDGFHE